MFLDRALMFIRCKILVILLFGGWGVFVFVFLF